MYGLKRNEVFGREIAQFLNADLQGPNFIVTRPCTLDDPASGGVLLVDDGGQQVNARLHGVRDILAIAPTVVPLERGAVIAVADPTLAFARVINEFFVDRGLAAVHPTAIISPSAKLGRNVSVGPYCIIGPEAEVGDESEILQAAVISGAVHIGQRCLIKSGATIGSEGYAFVSDEQGRPVAFPPCGRVLIGDNTWIGANSTIERSAFQNTVIGNDVKIDDVVHIGNGARIGDSTMITAGVVVSRDSRVGRHCWLMPGACVAAGISIADHVTLGMGSVLIRDIDVQHSVYVGNPARRLIKN